MTQTHVVKSWPRQFEAVRQGIKTAELRKDDRGYAIGDRLLLKEFDPETQSYSGRWQTIEITHILNRENICAVSKQALHDDYAILSIKRVWGESNV